ncbi:hypothetical protein E4T49_07966 [Aureobasidium sp. EXF-10728]|nr:hypothetical protein E4T49_07966 [Aureobasidium sp. EXF-10728]
MLSTTLKFLSLALLGSRAAAQTVEPFILDGRLDSATASDGSYNSGGTISVNGYSVTIPQNLQVQFPAAFAPFKDFASAGSFVGHEVSVIGNVVNGKAIAGLVQIGQYLLQASSGTVESINFAAGTMKIKGGPTIAINDPNAVYSAGYTKSPLYTADDENPSITAFSGFPMCIPRSSSDPLCPSSNRPSGQSTLAPDPLKMAPFQVGDYLEYSGINDGGIIVCYTIVAPSVQITTSGAPTYIRVEDAIVGIFDGGTTSEFGDSKFIGYTSDPTAGITVSAIDVDPCTGEETERSVGSASYKAGDARNKWTWRAATTTTSKYTREYVIRASTGEKLTDNKINAGRYVQPVLEFLFPEANVPGIVPPVNDFSNFPFLAQGLGYDGNGNLFGQLNPWPGASAPAVKSCGAYSPPAASSSVVAPSGTASTATDASASATSSPSSSASAAASTPTVAVGDTQTTRPGVVVKLSVNVTNKADFNANDLTYTWSQVSGPTVTLSSTSATNPSLTAPSSTAKATYIFNIKASSIAAGTSANANITVISDPAIKDIVTIESYTWNSSGGGSLSVTATTNIVGYDAKLKLYLTNTASGTATALTWANGKYSVNLPKTKKPANGITVVSEGGGSKSVTAVTA